MTMRLAYGTNVAPSEDLAGLLASFGGLWAGVRRRASGALGPDGTLGLGIWFGEDAARAAASDAGALRAIRDALAANGLRLETANAFPQRGFHAPVVKDAVYRPDWTDPARFAYTAAVARVVAGVAPPGSDVPVSTLPLGFPKWDVERRLRASGLLLATVIELDRLRQATGTTVRLALEPEPCCAIETSAEVIEFFHGAVFPFAGTFARSAGVSATAAEEMLRRHLGVCLDLCHCAVEHEDPWDAYRRVRGAGIAVPKVQVSAAVTVPDPTDPGQRAALAAFAEPRWLHQTGVAPGAVVRDLPEALADPALARRAPWRVHFHVPLHADTVGGLPTTRADVERFLERVRGVGDPPVLEIETYTWSVVPGASADLADDVAAEIGWVAARIG